MTADHYQEFQNSCIQELQAKQAATAEILLFADNRIDLTKGTIEWIDDSSVQLSHLKELSASWDRPEFLSEHPFAASEKDAWAMVAVVCHQLGGAAAGICGIPRAAAVN